MARNAATTAAEKQKALRRQATPSTAPKAFAQALAAPSLSVLQRTVADPQAAHPSEILRLQRTYGNQAVQRLLHAAGGPAIQRQGREASAQTPPLASSITPLLQRQPVVQRVDAPSFKKKYPLSEAVTQLHTSRTDGSDNVVIGNWIQYIVQKITPTAGPVKSTYVSSFDTAKGGFSASRALPDVPDLVVHAHYQRDLSAPKTAKVNSAQVKWSDKEEGEPPPGQTKIPPALLPKVLGATHDQEAITHWNNNPDRHQMRAKAKDIKAKKDWNKDKDKSPWGDGAPDWFD